MSQSPRLVAMKLLRTEYAQHAEALARFPAKTPAPRGALTSGVKHVTAVCRAGKRHTDRRRLRRSDLEHARACRRDRQNVRSGAPWTATVVDHSAAHIGGDERFKLRKAGHLA
jgi:hypothetical protein